MKCLIIFFLILSVIFIFTLIYKLNYAKNNLKQKIIYKINNLKDNTILLFWTGGYDSTFRLCQLLIDERKYVQPIYISSIIDNNEFSGVRRKSQNKEIETMNQIVQILNNQYPYIINLLYPLININEKIIIDYSISKCMQTLKKQGRVRRSICQYGALSQLSQWIKKPIEISVEKDPIHSIMYKTINDFLNKDTININKITQNSDKCLLIFKYFKFGTIHLSKSDMLNIAVQNGYENILKITWSCWFPQNGKKCEQCNMCKERII